MFIDRKATNPVLNITTQIDFPHMPCATLDVNALDSKMTNLFGGGHEILKTRLDSNGKPISRAPKIRDGFREVSDSSVIFWTAMNGGHWSRAQTSGMHLRCPPCYTDSFENHATEDDCCNRCASVKSRGIPVTDTSPWIPEQCLGDMGYWTKFPPQDGEGCRFDLRASLAKLTGISQVIITLKEKLDMNTLPSKTKTEFARHYANMSHTITRLAFGDTYPGLVDVLDGRTKTQIHQQGSTRFQYDLHLIPTKYQYLSGQMANSHQYSVTEYAKKVVYHEGDNEHGVLSKKQDLTAGVYMNYDVTPFTVKVTEWKKSWTHFITECCAILGGIFAFSGMLDTFVYRISKTFARRFTGETVFDNPASALYSN